VAADYKKIVADLLAFYDFKDRTILTVGAGGGQLIEYGRTARKVLALDSDAAALDQLRENLKVAGLEDKFEPILGDFFTTELTADVALFEFSLHEMADPAAALERARRLAPEVVVSDHGPGSLWSYITAEEDKVVAAWAAVCRQPVRKTRIYDGAQVFAAFDELYDKVKGQGETSLARIERYRGQAGIRIPMTYGLALIGGGPSPIPSSRS
jgi:ubiquinone/menaquinone biosynthesis C-methylase UbiE